MFFFTLKKLISRIFFPFPMGLEIITSGLILLISNKAGKMRLGKILIFSGIVFLYAAGTEPVIDQLVYPFEHKYMPVSQKVPGIKYIVVLGGDYESSPELPANMKLRPLTLSRVIEALRLKSIYPEALIIFSGGRMYRESLSCAEVMKIAAIKLGINKKQILLNSSGYDTRGEVVSLKNRLDGEKFLLVTSASHMRRAEAMFKKEGLYPVPSPSSYLSPVKNGYTLMDFFPSWSGMQKSERLIYEIQGLLWAKIRKYI